MKVKHLINELKNCDPNSIVNVVIRKGATPETDIWTDDLTEVVEYEDKYKWVVIDFYGGSSVEEEK